MGSNNGAVVDQTLTTGIKKSKKKTKKSTDNYTSYISKILKVVEPSVSTSKDSVTLVNSILDDFAERLIMQANKLTKIDQKSTVKAKHVQAATQLLLVGGLQRHAVSDGTRAVALFASA